MFVESQGGDLGGRLMGVLPGWAIYAADLVFAMFMLINLMGCLWLFTGLTENDQGGQCWLESVGKFTTASRKDLRICKWSYTCIGWKLHAVHSRHEVTACLYHLESALSKEKAGTEALKDMVCMSGLLVSKPDTHLLRNVAGGMDLRKAGKADQYVAAVHFAMTTMATVGESLTPHTSAVRTSYHPSVSTPVIFQRAPACQVGQVLPEVACRCLQRSCHAAG
jgi:hypothetical protein